MNLTVFIVQYFQTQSNAFSYGTDAARNGLVDKFILAGPLVGQGEWWRLITAGFLHEAIVHIAMNMLALWRIGHVWEPRLGSGRFFGVYVASLLGGSLAVMLFTPQVRVLGASGAIFGFLGLEFAAYRQRKIPIMTSPLAQVLLLNLVISFVFPVSITGHLGGALAGAVVGGYFTNPKRKDSSNQKAAMICVVACVVLFVLSLYFAYSPINPKGILPR